MTEDLFEYSTCICGLPIKALKDSTENWRWTHDVLGYFLRGCRAALFGIDQEKWLNSNDKGYARPSKKVHASLAHQARAMLL